MLCQEESCKCPSDYASFDICHKENILDSYFWQNE